MRLLNLEVAQNIVRGSNIDLHQRIPVTLPFKGIKPSASNLKGYLAPEKLVAILKASLGQGHNECNPSKRNSLSRQLPVYRYGFPRASCSYVVPVLCQTAEASTKSWFTAFRWGRVGPSHSDKCKCSLV